MRKVIRKKIEDKATKERSFYLTDKQNKYLLERSVAEFGQANRKSQVIREIIDIAMEVNPIKDM